MAKTIQMAKMNVFGRKFSVVYHQGKRPNPFYLYEHKLVMRDYGYSTESKYIVEKYANFESCLYRLLNMKMPEFRKDF